MPQIGWFEILIVVVLAILIIGPKDFPIVIRKIGSWVGTFRNYFSVVQKDLADMESSIDEEIPFEESPLKVNKNKKTDE